MTTLGHGTADRAELATVLRDFVTTTDARAPLYARLAAGVADADDVLDILAAAPAQSRLPVTLFAAVHDLLLADPSLPLAQWYPNLTAQPRTDDPSAAFIAFCAEHREQLLALVSTRVPQTNEVGRSALLLVGLARIAAEVGPLAQLDVGASAGANLILDRLCYDFAGHRLGAGEIELSCGIRGVARPDRLPDQLPRVLSRAGLDRNPVDVGDAEQVRWLQACVWPDQTDRFQRLKLALEQIAACGVRVHGGDAVTDVAAAVADLGPGHPVITTSWVLNYLGEDGQRAFVEACQQMGATQDLSVVSYESPELTTGLDWPQSLRGEELSVLRVTRWRHGQCSQEYLAKGHPHGYWLEWLD